MQLYTLQHIDAYKNALKKRYFSGNHQFSMGLDPELGSAFKNAYIYMQEQMKLRLYGFSQDLPMWAFLEKPELRRTVWEISEPHVCLTIEVPSHRIILSDFDMWHSPLNNHPCFKTEAKWDHWDKHEKSYGENFNEHTWKLIFDISAPTSNAEIDWIGKNRTLQACIDRIYLNEITHINYINPHPRRKKRV